MQKKVGGALGADLSQLRVYGDARAHQRNVELKSSAFAEGRNLFFRNGEYKPGSKEGNKLIAHEAAHTIQQGAIQRNSAESESQNIPTISADSSRFCGPQRSSRSDGEPERVPVDMPKGTFKSLDPSSKHYRDSDLRKVNSPGGRFSGGFVCGDTTDGEQTVCRKVLPYFFDTMNTLSMPGQSSHLDYSKPSSTGEPAVRTTHKPVDLGKHTVLPKDDGDTA